MTVADSVPLGVTPAGESRWNVLVWAPASRRVRFCPQAGPCRQLQPVEDPEHYGGYHYAEVEDVAPGELYRIELDGELVADATSRSQPEGAHGPSAAVDLAAMPWADDDFLPVPLERAVLYELHIGTFTKGGTLDSAIDGLDPLVELGITAVEPMPVSQFSGRRNWGYDGVFPFAVHDTYGGPGALQRFVDACHSRGLAVVLDVVYNHLGPEGSVLGRYGPYLNERSATPWGPGVNFDGEGSDEVRRYFIENACMWLEDFHVDMLRLDAVHGIVDRTARTFLQDLTEAVSSLAVRLGRRLELIAESADNDPMTITPVAMGGSGFDAQWCDDFHHALHSVLTGERRGYYADFGSLEQLAASMSHGFVLEGQYCRARRRRHGARPTMARPAQFVVFAQNHDQVGNRPSGDRLSTLVPPEGLRLAAACTLLSPFVPLLFMGEEYGETAPFPYFVDYADPELMDAVARGRREEMASLWAMDGPDPGDELTFSSAMTDPGRRSSGTGALIWGTYRALLQLRRDHPAFSPAGPGAGAGLGGAEGAGLGAGAGAGLVGPVGNASASATVASAEGDLLRVIRRSAGSEAVLLANFGSAEVVATLHGPPHSWEELLSSEAPSLVSAPAAAGEAEAGSPRPEETGRRVPGSPRPEETGPADRGRGKELEERLMLAVEPLGFRVLGRKAGRSRLGPQPVRAAAGAGRSR